MSADYYRRCVVVIDAGKAESKALCRRLCPWGPLEGLYVLGGGLMVTRPNLEWSRTSFWSIHDFVQRSAAV